MVFPQYLAPNVRSALRGGESSGAFAGVFLGTWHQTVLSAFRGTPRDDLRPSLRTVPFRRCLTIAYAVKSGEVRIIGIARARQDLEGLPGEG